MLVACKSGLARSTNACLGNAILAPDVLRVIPETTELGESVAPKYSPEVCFGVSDSTRTSNAPPSFKVPSSVTRLRVTTCHWARAVAANTMKRIAFVLTQLLRPAATQQMSVSFDRRTFAVFDAALLGALLAQCRDTQVPDLIVDLAKGGFGKFMRRLHRLLKLRDARERAVGLFAWQCFQNLANVFDFRNPMTDHYEIVAGSDGEANCLVEAVSV